MDDVFGGLEDQPGPGETDFAVIDIDRAEVRCGDTVSGSFSWNSSKDIREVEVALRYRTEGRGTENSENVDVLTLPGAPRGSTAFEFRVPSQGPMTHFGNLITLRWEVVAKLDVAMRRDPSAEVEIHVGPRTRHGA